MPKVVDDFHDRNHLTFLPVLTAITFWRCVNIWRYICGNTATETENSILHDGSLEEHKDFKWTLNVTEISMEIFNSPHP